MMEIKTLEDSLKEHFGYRSFRIGQKEIIASIMAGNSVLGILPTGVGKSICDQLPAKLLKGTTVIVSPLIALMLDQVKQLKATGFKEVIALNSFIDRDERKQMYGQLGKYKLIYVSPELLQQPDLLIQLKKLDVSLFAVDEAHCISQWGHEFRPDYLKLDMIIHELGDPVVLALSATASHTVQTDIATFLNRPNIEKHIFPIDRENIALSVATVHEDQEKIAYVTRIFTRYRVSALIYFSSREKAETVASTLFKKLPDRRIAFYHGGMEQTDRIIVQQQFMNDQLDIICCTSAFGMGINKENIRLVIHFHMPAQIESYIQEIGRAGRDGNPSAALLLYAGKDPSLPRQLIRKELPTEAELFFVLQKLSNLYKTNQKLPQKTEEIEKVLHLTEIGWRFLHYQFEKHGMMKGKTILFQRDRWNRSMKKIQDVADARIQYKEKKLWEMIGWVHGQDCLRKSLYENFQDSYTSPASGCCSNCGFQLSDWNPVQTTVTPNAIFSWQDKLQMLLIGDRNEKPK